MQAKIIAILIPCYNESATIAEVIKAFKAHVPHARIYVYDNQSTDKSAEIAAREGAIVRHVQFPGKGQVVRRMFAEINADVYVMVDGDATYDASVAPRAIECLEHQHLDMVVCTREPSTAQSFPAGHTVGNRWFNGIIHFLYGKQFTDVFSGYRIFSRRFVKSFPVISHGFEIEAEMSIHSLQLGIPTAELAAPYFTRPPGSTSKLRTIKDGLKILRTILLMFMYIRPMAMFGSVFLLLAGLSLILGLPVIVAFIKTGLVPRIPTAILAASLGVLASIALACGIILDSISRARLETKRFWYLLVASIK